MDSVLIVIPAIKKNVAFPDDLVKKLAGITLIQRAISIAVDTVAKSQILVVTDSAEIDLICQRQGVPSHLDPALRLSSPSAGLLGIAITLKNHVTQWQTLIVLSPYAPLLSATTLKTAYEDFRRLGKGLLVPAICFQAKPFSPAPQPLRDRMQAKGQVSTVESTAFLIVNQGLLVSDVETKVEAVSFPLDEALIEIHNYHEWWLCEKLLNRRRIVFRVIGHKDVGMGHIYRCLALAHEISDHQVVFICDTESGVASKQLAGYDYWLNVCKPDEIEQTIFELDPHLVVNDILDTDAEYIRRLRARGIPVLNFEDMGSGATEADLTINDLYDEPLIPGNRIVWGHSWFFLRDEFNDAKPHEFELDVKRLLITFGGTDPSDYTRRVLTLLAPYCAGRGIGIDVVTGGGYCYIDMLEALIPTLPGSVNYSHASGTISRIMERTQIAICSNGRTVYELAHMNIPAVVLSQHARELSHRFACEENGFIQLDIPDGPGGDLRVLQAFHRLFEDTDYRRRMFENMQGHCFVRNKDRVVRRLQALLH